MRGAQTMTPQTAQLEQPAALTCGTCRHHSARDACCALTGATRKRRTPACTQHGDGTARRSETQADAPPCWGN